MLRKFLCILQVVAPAALADILSSWEHQGIINIHFSEPVVTQSVLDNQHRSDCSDEDKGLDLFSISGDEKHPPRVFWVDQDCLRMEPSPGSSVKTEYTLRFRSDARYLSGRLLQKREYRFRAPASPLLHEDLRTCPNGAALLAARFQNTSEAASLSPDTPIKYTYTRLKMDDRGDFFESGEKAGAIVEQARLCHGYSFSVLQSLARRGVKWEELQQDSPLPGYVVVRPDKPVPAGSIWRLNAKPADGCGIAESNLGPIYVNRQLSASLEQVESDEPGELRTNALQLRFNSLVEKAQLQQAFRDMRLTLDGVETTLSEDGLTRSAMVNGRELRVRYLGEIEPHHFTIKPQDPENEDAPSAWDDKQETDRLVRYSHPTASPGILLAVESPSPVQVECTLKPGMTGIHGLPLEQEFACRCSITPLVPGLPQLIRHHLPLYGRHLLQLEAVNGSRVRVRLRHWKADEVAAALPKINSHLEQQSRRTDMALHDYRRAVKRARINARLADPEDMPPPTDNATRAREVYRDRIFLQGAGGTIVGQQELVLPAPANPLKGVEYIQVDLDALCGGQPRPGLYMVEMDFYPSDAVLAAAKSLGMAADDWELRSDALVSVSDLSPLAVMNADTQRQDLLVLRHSTGEPLNGGTVVCCSAESRTSPAPVKHGYAPLPEGESEVIVREGEDYCVVANPNIFGQSDEKESDGNAELRAMVWTDRDVYRPGDKVHVRGYLRAVDGLNRITHSKHRTLELLLEAPDGSRLFSRTFNVDSYGAFSQELRLPAGDDDFSGSYVLRVRTTYPRTLVTRTIQCETHERESFTCKMIDGTAKIAPAALELCVRTQDLNGLPMNDGRVGMRVVSDAPLKGARFIGTEENPAYEWQGEVPLTKSGTALFILPLEEEAGSDFSVQYQGTVVNGQGEAQYFGQHARYAAAELRPELPADNRLRLLCTHCDQPFNGGLAVKVSLRVPLRTGTPLPSGFTLNEYQYQEVWSQWVNVPASCTDGVALPIAEQMAQHVAPDSVLPCIVEVMGRDYSGRVFKSKFVRRAGQALPMHRFSVSRGKNPGLVVVEAGADGKVLLVMRYGKRVHAYTMELQRGYHEFALPLMGDEEGLVNVNVSRLETSPHTGCFEACNQHHLQVHMPRRHSMLQVNLDLPGTVRPGTQQHLSGRVTLPDGSPAQAVVTLYAVDAGELAHSAYQCPDAVAALSQWSDGGLYIMDVERADSEYRDGRFLLQHRFLPGVWAGEGRMAGGSWQLQPWWMRVSSSSEPFDLSTGAAVDSQAVREESQSHSLVAADAAASHVRRNFAPVALWCGALKTDADGRFATTCTLPDTLTTYRVFAVAADKGGCRFGSQEGEFTVNQPLILRAGLPQFMSVGDTLQLPVTVTNNTKAEGTWQVQLEGAGAPQQVVLPPGGSTTLLFEVTAQQSGSQICRWVATGASGQDAVEGSFEVRHPAPLLKEAHHLTLVPGQEALVPRSRVAEQLAAAPGVEYELLFSANPLLHLAGGADALLAAPADYLTEYRASALLPWLLYDRMAPLCPRLEQTVSWRVPYVIARKLRELLKYQNEDGSLPAFWREGPGCLWTSAHVAMVLRVAEDRGCTIPQAAWNKLLAYLEKADMSQADPLTRYAAARALQQNDALAAALNDALAAGDSDWRCSGTVRQDLEFLQYLRSYNDGRHEAFLRWVRSRSADYRHQSSWRSAWSFYALITYIGNSRGADVEASLRLPSGRTVSLNRGAYAVQDVAEDGHYSAARGTVYALLRAKARPQQTEYPGVTEKGLQMTRVYEKKAEDGTWRPATEFTVGDVVRVSLTCAKAGEQELNHLVLEDYLPSCMEAINPALSDQAAGLDALTWSECFDQREYLADRVRGFCTRWPGRDVVNMRYYARVKRAGSAIAPPAQAQLHYEPQTYGLSPSARISASPQSK